MDPTKLMARRAAKRISKQGRLGAMQIVEPSKERGIVLKDPTGA